MTEELSPAAQLIAGIVPPSTEPAEEPTVLDESPPAEEPSDIPEPEAPEVVAKEPEEATPLEFSADMYELTIPGLDMTIGEFKDRAKDLSQADKLNAHAEERQITVQNQLLRAQQDLQAFAAQMGIQPTEQQLAQISQQRTEFTRQQDVRLAQAIPEWSDPDVRKADMLLTDSLLTEYQFTGPEQANLTDWRFAKLARDYAKLRSRVKSAVDGEIKPKSAPKARKAKVRATTGKDEVLKAFNSGKMSQNEAVSALLMG
jgi:hypothetical protein